jgi:hypothetical protein
MMLYKLELRLRAGVLNHETCQLYAQNHDIPRAIKSGTGNLTTFKQIVGE